MAVTVIPSGTKSSGSHIVEHWARSTFAEGRVQSFFMGNGFVSAGTESVLQERTELQKEPGDTVHMVLIPDLEGDGVVGDSEVEGNGEPLRFFLDSVVVDQLRHEVELPGRMSRKRVAYGAGLREIAKERLGVWAGRNALDKKIFRHLAGVTSETFPQAATAPTTNRWMFGGDETSEAGIDGTGDFQSIEEIERAEESARTSDPMVQPIMINGEPHYIYVMHPRCAYSLRNQGTGTVATTYRNALRDARERSPNNPLFTGALGLWNNVILYQHQDIPLLNNGVGSRPVARNLFLGRQAGYIGFGSEPFWVEETEDRGNRLVVTYGQIYGIKKAVFNSEDFGVIVVSVDAPVPTGTSHT